MVNGLLIRAGGPSVSFAFKFLVLAVVALATLKYLCRAHAVFVVMLVAFYAAIHMYLLGNFNDVTRGLDFLIKFAAIVIFYLFFSQLIKDGYVRYVLLIAKISFAALFLNILLGVLGFGFPMYVSGGIGIGTRGLIFAGNEIGGALLVSGSMIMAALLLRDSFIRFLLLGVVMILMAGAMTNKVPILGGMMLLVAFPVIRMLQTWEGFYVDRKAFYFNAINGFIFPLFVTVGLYLALYQSGLMARLTHFYETNGLLMLLLSGREVWMFEAIAIFKQNYSALEMLFGTGFTWFNDISVKKSVEIDLFDFLMSYGVLGVTLAYGVFFYMFGKALLRFRVNRFAPYLAFTIALLIGVSLTSGHIMYSGTAGYLIAMLFALTNFRNDEVVK
ncbi:hypothetical protein [Aliidiomarina sp. Khilg15.8]